MHQTKGNSQAKIKKIYKVLYIYHIGTLIAQVQVQQY